MLQWMRLARVFANVLAPPLLQVKSVVLHLQEGDAEHQPPVQAPVAQLEQWDRLEADVSATRSAVRRLQREEVARRLLQDRAFQIALCPGIKALSEERPCFWGTAEALRDYGGCYFAHSPNLHSSIT